MKKQVHVLAVLLEFVRPHGLALDAMPVTVGDDFLYSGKNVAGIEGGSAVAVRFYGNPTRVEGLEVLREGKGGKAGKVVGRNVLSRW